MRQQISYKVLVLIQASSVECFLNLAVQNYENWSTFAEVIDNMKVAYSETQSSTNVKQIHFWTTEQG